MLIIGESINCAIPRVAEAVVARDRGFIAGLAKRQVECGAQMLDIFAALAGRDQAEDLVWAVGVVQEAVPVPLMLDSTDAAALRAAMAVCRQPPMLSSITAEEHRVAGLLPLVASSSGLVALCMDEKGIPPSPEGRLKIAETLTRRLAEAHVRPEQIWFDPMILTIGSDASTGKAALETVSLIRQHLPGAHTIAAISNVSFGMPNRRLLNRTFLAMMVAHGVDSILVDVRDEALMATLKAAIALAGQDEFCIGYLKAYRAGKLK